MKSQKRRIETSEVYEKQIKRKEGEESEMTPGSCVSRTEGGRERRSYTAWAGATGNMNQSAILLFVPGHVLSQRTNIGLAPRVSINHNCSPRANADNVLDLGMPLSSLSLVSPVHLFISMARLTPNCKNRCSAPHLRAMSR